MQGMWVPPWMCERFPGLFAPYCVVSSSGEIRLSHVCREPLGHRDNGSPHECRLCGYRWMDSQLRRTRRRLRRERELSWWQKLVKAWENADPGPDTSEEDPEWEQADKDGRIW